MVIIAECLKRGCEILKGFSDFPLLEAEILLASILKKDRLYLNIHKKDSVSGDVLSKLEEMCIRRSGGEPVAYITGTKEFMSLEFEVNPNVLIPRPDTEILVEYICEKYKNRKVRIVDMCTGSGAIACSLAHYLPDSFVCATDISDDVIATAMQNSVRNSVESNTSFFVADALKPLVPDSKFDVVVSNPPYIESGEIPLLMRDVRDFEPISALDGGTDGLIFYTKIVDNIDSCLKKGGELVFEIGFNQGDSVSEIMKEKFTDITVHKDFAGNDRMVCGQLA